MTAETWNDVDIERAVSHNRNGHKLSGCPTPTTYPNKADVRVDGMMYCSI